MTLQELYQQYQTRPQTLEDYARAQGYSQMDNGGQWYRQGDDGMQRVDPNDLNAGFSSAGDVSQYIGKAGNGQYVTYDPNISLDTPSSSGYQREGMKTVRDALKHYDPGFNEANWLAPNSAQNPFDRPVYQRSDQYNYKAENPETDFGAGIGSWLKAMSAGFGLSAGLAGISGAIAGTGFGAGASGFAGGLTDSLGITGPNGFTGADAINVPPGSNMLADAGGAVSDASSAAAGSFANPDLLPAVNVSAPAAASGSSTLPYLLGGAGALAGGAALFGGLGSDSSAVNLPNNITPEAAPQFADSFKQMATDNGWSLDDITKALNNPALRTLLGAGLNLGTAAFGANAVGNATQAQLAASNAAIAEQRRQYDQTRADNAPFLATGTAANGRLRQLLGLDASYTGADSGSLTRKFSDADMQADPVYKSGLQFGLNEGTKGINARAIGTGSYDSGATLKALTRYGNDYASTKGNEAYQRYTADQGNVYNKLAGVSGAGQTAVNTVANAGTNATNAISGNLTDQGNSRAAGIVGGANAWGSAASGINNSLNQYGSNQILEALLKRGY